MIARTNKNENKAELDLMKKVKASLEKDLWVRQGEWMAKEVTDLNLHHFLTAKPVVYIVNLSSNDYQVYI